MTPPDVPAPALLENLARGDARALHEVCRIYGPRVYHLARRNLRGALRSYVESGDIAQECMATVIREAPGCRFPSEAAFLGWLRRIVEHRILAVAKRRQAARRREAAAEKAGEPRTPALNAETPSRIVMRKEKGDEVANALSALSSEDRALVIARAILRLSWDVIARVRGQSEAALQMRYVRVRRQLAKALVERDATHRGAARGSSDTSYPRAAT